MFFKDSPVQSVGRRVVYTAYIVKKVSACGGGGIAPAKIGIGLQDLSADAAAHIFPCRRIFYKTQPAYYRQPLAVVRIGINYAVFEAA